MHCLFFVFVCMWQYKEGKKLKPKPNYNSVDLSEVEWEDTEEKVSETHETAHLSGCNDLLFVFFLISVGFEYRTQKVKYWKHNVCVLAEDSHGKRRDWNLVFRREDECW